AGTWSRPAGLVTTADDAEAVLVHQELHAVEAAESRPVAEQLAGRFQALVINFWRWFPDVAPSLVVIDPAALVAARPKDRHALLYDLQARTRAGGVHVVLPTAATREVIPLAPESLEAQYAGWQLTRRRRTRR